MNVFEGLPKNQKFNNAVVTVGMYDGVHLAHKLILQRVCKLAKSIGGESVLVTFDPHPRAVLYPEEKIALLTTRDEKIALLESIGIDAVVFIPFNLEFSKTSSFEFVKTIIVDAIHARKIVVGYNHFFGHNREGNLEHLSKLGLQFGFEVEEIPEQDIQNESVSSSKIRKALSKGDMMRANAYLDYEYHITGNLKEAGTLFSSIGYEGYAVTVDSQKLIPANGLYFVNIDLHGVIYKGALWIHCDTSPEKAIELLIVDYHPSIQNPQAIITLKHLVRMCSPDISIETVRKSVIALLFQATP